MASGPHPIQQLYSVRKLFDPILNKRLIGVGVRLLTESLLTLKTIRVEEIFTLLVTLDSALSAPDSL